VLPIELSKAELALTFCRCCCGFSSGVVIGDVGFFSDDVTVREVPLAFGVLLFSLVALALVAGWGMGDMLNMFLSFKPSEIRRGSCGCFNIVISIKVEW